MVFLLEAYQEEMEQKEVPELKVQPALPPKPTQVPAPIPQPTPQPTPQPAPQPSVQADPRGIAPLPPTGLPEGWTQEQWNHFGWQYIEGFSKKK